MQRQLFTRLAAPALLGLSLLGGCTAKFLDEQPNDSLTLENYYRTEADAIAAATACYAQLGRGGQYNYALWGIGEIMSDNSNTGGGGGGDGAEHIQLDNFNIPATNPVVTRLWNGCYVGIGTANVALLKIPGIPGMDETVRDRCLGEARFLRAKYYFDLVRAFGGVPLILAPVGSTAEARAIPRAPVDSVYSRVIRDLKLATTLLPPAYGDTDKGRATRWAAYALLAKVYITQNTAASRALAAEAARTVIATNRFTLNTNYGDNFNREKENGPESIFEVQYKNGLQGGNNYGYTFDGEGSVRNEFFGPRGQSLVPQGGYGFNIPEPNFVSGYEANDKRKAVTVWVPNDVYPDGRKQPYTLVGSPYGYNCRKWFVGKDPLVTTIWDSPLNVPVLRLAEVYLILAEAVGPTPEGVGAINLVRGRAGLNPLPTGTANFTQAVWKERRYELAFEDDRWFDLKRTGQLLTNAHLQSKGIKPFNVLLPIPQSEIDSNPDLQQNPGY